MLTREEQEAILKQAQRLARTHIQIHRKLEKSEISPKRAKELIETEEEELRNMLKEIG